MIIKYLIDYYTNCTIIGWIFVLSIYLEALENALGSQKLSQQKI